MKYIARWLGMISRAFFDGFKRVDREPKWEVTMTFAHGTSERFSVSKETWAAIQRWLDAGEGGSFYVLETSDNHLRLNRDYVASVKGRKR